MDGSNGPAQGRRKDNSLHNTLVYMRQHWQLYLLFILPALALTLIFKYIPMGGVLIAFMDYNPFRGILGSEWVGFDHFRRFLTSPDFLKYLVNTLKLSVYGLLWGFPARVLLAERVNAKGDRIRADTVALWERTGWIADRHLGKVLDALGCRLRDLRARETSADRGAVRDTDGEADATPPVKASDLTGLTGPTGPTGNGGGRDA